MKKQSIILSVTVVLNLVLIAAVNAAEVGLNENVNIPLSVNGITETCELIAGNLDEFNVETDRINITSTSSQLVRLQCSSSISFGAGTSCTTPGKSTIEVPQNSSVLIIPTRPTSTSADYKDSCDGRVVIGGGGGGGGGAITPSTPPVVVPVVKAPAKVGKSKKEPRPVSFSDLGKVSQPVVDQILAVVNAMVESGTYAPTSRYQPKNVATWDFALRMGLAIAGKNCGDLTSYASCRKVALESGLISSNAGKKGSNRIKRAEFYSLLLGGKKIPLSKQNIKRCKDLKATSLFANAVGTALKYKIGKVYKGGKCSAGLFFNRVEAAEFAHRALTLPQQE